MDPVWTGIIGSCLLFLLLVMGMPIAFALMFMGFIGIAYIASLNAALTMVARIVYESSSSFPYTVIPLFIVMGGYAGVSGLSRDLYTAFDKWSRRLPAGLGIATIASCAGFAAISGSSVATAATMGMIAYPEMRRFNYSPTLASGIIAAGGTLAFLIPPSLGFVVYGMLTEQSIGRLLISGILPGLVLAGAYMAVLIGFVKLRPDLAPSAVEPVSFREKLVALKGVWETLAIFLVVIGGIYLGFLNPSEAAGVGAVILFVMALVKGKLNRQNLTAALFESVRITVMVLLLVAGASVFSYFLALSTIPMKASAWIVSLHVSRYVILAVIVCIYLILGCFLDAISMMVLTLPVVFPIMMTLKFDPIWFGVVCVIMMEAGLITPPMGLIVFTVAGIAKDAPIEDIFKGALPFLIAMLFVTFLITVFPQIALFLPSLMSR